MLAEFMYFYVFHVNFGENTATFHVFIFFKLIDFNNDLKCIAKSTKLH